jgi:hypothetical protein
VSERINVTGNQGARRFLAERGVTFETSNPKIDDVTATIERLRAPHPRHKGHKGCAEAAELLDILLERNA